MPEPSKELEAAARAAAEAAFRELEYRPLDRPRWVDSHWREFLIPLRAAIAEVLREPSPELVAAIAEANCEYPGPDSFTAAEDALRAAARHVLGEDT